jgi:hypothetical protein
MGAEGRGPKPYQQVQLRTTFIRVPTGDWAAIKRGAKTEFRSMGGNTSPLWRVKTPCPVVIYKASPTGHQAQLMVLVETWREKLVEMSPGSLEAEGFETFEEFRHYWMRRERRKFMPMSEVSVYKLRPWTDEDREPMAEALLERLYGNFLP